jgi:hypothetical protein
VVGLFKIARLQTPTLVIGSIEQSRMIGAGISLC